MTPRSSDGMPAANPSMSRGIHHGPTAISSTSSTSNSLPKPIFHSRSRFVCTTLRSIEAIGGPRDQLAGRNDGLTKGVSQIACYQPLLGYRLEKFPRAPLRPGPVIAPIGDVINLKNPACYLYPQENNCRPGDHFTIDSLDDAVAFMTYRPFPFERPDWQDAASGVSLAALAATLAFLLMALLRLLIRKRT